MSAQDAHAHLLEQGYKMQLQLDGAASVQDVVGRIKAFILARPDVHADRTRWIQGMGWDQTKWPGAEFPTAVCRSCRRCAPSVFTCSP